VSVEKEEGKEKRKGGRKKERTNALVVESL
jgi:hypothetical protein